MAGNRLEREIPAELAGKRLDQALAQLVPEQSRSFLQKLIREGKVRAADGSVLDQVRQPVRAGQLLVLELPEPVSGRPAPEPFAFPILYEDDQLLVIDKPAGVAVHPGAGLATGTVVNALLSRYPEITDWAEETPDRPGIVHRLDKDTSGCLVIAKTASAQFRLATAFAERKVHKTYLALVNGRLRTDSGRIEKPIGRHPVNRRKMAENVRGAKPAITLYRVRTRGWLEQFPVSLLEVDILTGRTHQIRVHLAGLGHPVVGDALYAPGRGPQPGRQLLHAWHLTIPHPETGAELRFESPIPPDFRTALDQLTQN